MTSTEFRSSAASASRAKPKYPGIRVTCSGNQLVTQYVETRITEGGVFYPITPSTEGGEIYQASYASGELNVWGQQKVAAETEGEHAAQGGATAFAVTGRRTVSASPTPRGSSTLITAGALSASMSNRRRFAAK